VTGDDKIAGLLPGSHLDRSAFSFPPPLQPALGLVNAFLYARWKAEELQVTRGRAFGAYMLAVLMANVLYLAFAVAYYAIVSAI